MKQNRIFFKSTVVNSWELVSFEDLKAGDTVKLVELSPDQTEVLSEIWQVTSDYSPKTEVFEGNCITNALYLPATKEMKELFKSANSKH